ARDEVIDSGVTPELDFLGHEPRRGNRIIERDGVAGVEASHERRLSAERRHRLGEAKIADRCKIARPLVGEHERHAIDDERLDDARDEALAEANDIEIAVEIAREADERTPVVVAGAVEDPDAAVL